MKLSEAKSLVKNKVQENLHLEYKASAALLEKKRSHNIAKEVSSFAHSDGGTIIYGIQEEGHIPVAIDGGLTHSQFTRETLEQIILSNIDPRIEGIHIEAIPLPNRKSIFVVEIPKSTGKVHQVDHKYYKRFDFIAIAMEDYEINDVRNRRRLLQLIRIDLEIINSFFCLVISNKGDVPASDVSFSFPEGFTWRGNRDTPPLIRNGVAYFPPGETYRLQWQFVNSLLSDGYEAQRKFTASVKYLHPDSREYVVEDFHFDAGSHYGTVPLHSEVHKLDKTVADCSRKLIDEIKKINQQLEAISAISQPAGLHLSTTTLRNLRRILAGDTSLERLDAAYCTEKVFREVLNIGFDLAFNLEQHFRWSGSGELEEIEGMTPEVMERLKQDFYFETPNT